MNHLDDTSQGHQNEILGAGFVRHTPGPTCSASVRWGHSATMEALLPAHSRLTVI